MVKIKDLLHMKLELPEQEINVFGKEYIFDENKTITLGKNKKDTKLKYIYIDNIPYLKFGTNKHFKSNNLLFYNADVVEIKKASNVLVNIKINYKNNGKGSIYLKDSITQVMATVDRNIGNTYTILFTNCTTKKKEKITVKFYESKFKSNAIFCFYYNGEYKETEQNIVTMEKKKENMNKKESNEDSILIAKMHGFLEAGLNLKTSIINISSRVDSLLIMTSINIIFKLYVRKQTNKQLSSMFLRGFVDFVD